MGHGTLSIGLVRPRILQKLVLYVMMVVLRMVDWHLNTFWTWLQLRIFLPFQEHAAHDQLPVMQGVATCRLLYGTEWYERENDRNVLDFVVSASLASQSVAKWSCISSPNVR